MSFMELIQVLNPHLADLIAAGEVVERPGSVVKELLENAIDAGAKHIQIEIKNGGMTYIRVRDDGCGMSPADAGIAFLRHATSKLRCSQDLEAIATLGFRGEALAAIAAVSRIELQTKTSDEKLGVRMLLEGGEIVSMDQTGCPPGTTITIQDLFYNTPARLKFLKSNRSEGQYCRDLALRCALGHPEVSIRFLKDKQEDFHSPGDGTLDSTIYGLFGRDVSQQMIPCQSEYEGISIAGRISSPRHGRGNRANQFFYCNGRYIKSTVMQAALEQAYKNTLLMGKFPACILQLQLGYSQVDVNVHPTKIEVKFSNEKKVFDSVYYAAVAALTSEKTFCITEEDAPFKPNGVPRLRNTVWLEEDVKKHVFKKELTDASQDPSGLPVLEKQEDSNMRLKDTSYVAYQGQNNDSEDYGTIEVPKVAVFPDRLFAHREQSVPKTTTDQIMERETAAQNIPAYEETSLLEQETLPRFPTPDGYRMIGQALGTYIILETNDGLVFIDMHAAHERLLFDELLEKKQAMSSQTLLSPIPLVLTEEDTHTLLMHQKICENMGFCIDAYGESSVIIRGVPIEIDAEDAAPMLEEVLHKIKTHQSPDFEDALLHSIACKAAVKSGNQLDDLEMKKIVETVYTGRVKYCPHGRPVSVSMSKKDIDKQFGRIL